MLFEGVEQDCNGLFDHEKVIVGDNEACCLRLDMLVRKPDAAQRRAHFAMNQ